MLESVRAAVRDEWQVTVVLPSDGPLAPRAAAAGAQVLVADFPVLRKALLHPRRLIGFVLHAARATFAARRWLRQSRPDVLYVSTITLPTWSAAGRLARVPVLVHTHEAQEDVSLPVQVALAAPLLLADRIVANSQASATAVTTPFTRLGRRTQIVYNGVPGPPTPPTLSSRRADDPLRLLLLGRLSPRKGPMVALEAVARLVAEGRDVTIRLAGSVFPGYEWFEKELLDRATAPDLAGRVEMLGYVHDRWARLAEADIVLMPSTSESFGNAAVEAMLALRPVVVSATRGLVEIVTNDQTGLLVPVADPDALAQAVARLADDPELAGRLATTGRAEAERRFGVGRYGRELATVLDALVSPPGPVDR